jgi:lipopolysaccharide heptosyltransferase II
VNTGSDTAAWREARRLLAVRLDNLGDLLMTTPALLAMKEASPGAHLALLTSPSGAALAPCLPWVDEVIVAEVPWMKPAGGTDSPEALGEREAHLVRRLAEGGFDAAVIFTVCTQSALPAALVCRMAGIPLRLAHCRENPYDLLTHWVADHERVQDGMRHEVERQLALVAAVGWTIDDPRLRLHTTAEHGARAAARLRAAGADPDRPYFVVHPGASAASRRYPAERFGAAADDVARQSGFLAVFTGDRQEAPLIAQAQTAMQAPSVSLAGQLAVGELAALIGGARLLLANNTGPAHIAAAMGTPVVALYALTNPQHTPWQVPSRVLNHDVPCRNCLKSVCPQGHHDCLLKVEPHAVATASLGLLARAAPA